MPDKRRINRKFSVTIPPIEDDFVNSQLSVHVPALAKENKSKRVAWCIRQIRKHFEK